ncbi:FCD domain-containing protein [Bradyrhizobium sp.]|uniref:FadR/GntR family transcriptional regulator n=1 Tax=Bradyrhizobium sp. TaxID=376 RepID=UPI001D6185A7|nr:FCD domain-containing protein [Bradyrhizobium sp.]MBI5322528.1 FadR family transcriptional regulator [Bradyrhizobium sp.]
MTVQHEWIAAPDSADKHALLAPLRPVRNRTSEVIDRISGEIASGRLAPGARLPTEAEMMSAMRVSRTVVREAVAALKANGLVITRQGAGAFVAPDQARISFRIDPDGLASIADVIGVMELRLAVEVEAAALAAERATNPAIEAIEEALADVDRAIRRGDTAISEDFAFHMAIAEATANLHYAEFLRFIGRHVIPRQSVRATVTSGNRQTTYLKKIQNEHRQIAAAIRARDVAAARRAMRTHLGNSLTRYRHLAEQAAPQP